MFCFGVVSRRKIAGHCKIRVGTTQARTLQIQCVGSHSTRWVVPLLCAFLRSALSRGALPPEPPGIYFPARMQGAVR